MKPKNSDQVLLTFLSICKNKQRIAVLKNLTIGQFQLVVSVIYNTLHAVLPISEEEKSKLGRHKRFIRQVLLKDITRLERLDYLLRISKQLPVFLKAFIEHGKRIDIVGKREI